MGYGVEMVSCGMIDIKSLFLLAIIRLTRNLLFKICKSFKLRNLFCIIGVCTLYVSTNICEPIV
jgi:hypothetical protein